MKRISYTLLALMLLGFSYHSDGQNAFNKGVNLTGWFGSGSARSIPFYKYTKKDLENIKSLGCDVIRLPINLHYMTSGAPDYTVDTMFFFFMDQVVKWTEELDINLILDNHTTQGAELLAVEEPLMKIWPQMAQHYKNESTHLFYEILNEPRIPITDWDRVQKSVLDTIRTIDSLHTVIVTGTDWGGIYGLTNLAPLSDTNLIYSYHFYDPFLFTHQGASWTDPSMVDLGGVPFPYDAARIPACPPSLKGTWVENSLKYNYKNDGTAAKLKSTIDQAIAYGTKNKVKIYCGELGVYILKSPEADRVEWYRTVTSYLTEKSVPWTMWDYQGGFGLFNKGSNETFEYDINRPLGEAMGFTLPPYQEYVFKPDTTGFDIYTDFMGKDLQYGGVPGGGIADLFSTDAYEGQFAVYMTETPQYGALDFDFKFNKDLSILRASNTTLSLWVKGSSKDASIVFRFLDTKTADPTDHPWRMDFTLRSTTKAPFDGNWYNVIIPLKSFIDVGSWDNAWYPSEKKFDWKAVDKFQIVAEQMPLTGKQFWFDNMAIIKGTADPVSIGQKEWVSELSIFPNPAFGITTISFIAPASGSLEVAIYDLTGKQVKSIVKGNCVAGLNKFTWDLTSDSNNSVTSGIYFCKLKSNNREIIRKISVIN